MIFARRPEHGGSYNSQLCRCSAAGGTILSVIQQEGNAAKVAQLFKQLPGATDLAQKYAVVVGVWKRGFLAP